MKAWADRLSDIIRAPDDLVICRLAVEQELVSQEQLADCVREHARRADRTLATLMVEAGVITKEQLRRLVVEQQRRLLDMASETPEHRYCATCRRGYPADETGGRCPTCGGAFSTVSVSTSSMRVPDLPDDVREAARKGDGIFGKFVKVSPLGKGGMGTVWRCYDPELRRHVAIKFLEAQGEAIAHFAKEARLAARLEHPNIARVYEVGNLTGQHYIVMQYVPGRTLGGRRLEMEHALRVMAKAARAIHYAHEHGVIHRDLKPPNIMIDESGEVYVLDFGLAKELTPGAHSVRSVIMGTPAYMSYEQATGQTHRIDARTDVYGLAATLYDVLTFRAPFEGDTAVEVLRRIQSEDPIPPRELRPDLPWEVETILLKALDKDSARRYQSARDFADDLERFLRGEAIQAKRAPLWHRVQTRIRRRPALYSAVAGAMLVAVLAGTFALGGLARARADLRRHLAEGHRRLDAGDLKGAQEAAALARAIDAGASRELWDAVIVRLAEADDERRRLADRERERAAVDPLLRTLGTIELAVATRADDAEAAIAAAVAILDEHEAWGSAWLAVGWAKRLRWKYGGPRLLVEQARQSLDVAVERLAGPLKAEALRQRALVHAEMVAQHAGGFNAIFGEGRFEWRRPPPDDAQTRQWTARAEEDLRALPDDESNARVRAHVQALLLYAQGSFADAAARLDGMTDVDALMLRAQSLFYGSNDRALQPQIEAIAELAGRRDALMLATEMNMAAGRSDRTEKFAERLATVDPESGLPWTYRGIARLHAADYDGAIEAFTHAIKHGPHAREAYLNRGKAHFDKRDVDAAIRDYARALETDPDYAEAHINLALAQLERREYEAAMKSINRGIQLRPRLALAHNVRARILRSTGKIPAAIAEYTVAIEIDPTFMHAWYNRALAHRALHEWAAAEQDFTRAIALAPNQSIVWIGRGMTRADLDRHDAAIDDFTRAAEVDPRNPTPLVHRALARESLAGRDGKREEELLEGALADFERALALAPATWNHRNNVEETVQRLRLRLGKE